MADERSVDDPVAQLGKLTRDFEDFRSTMIARLSRRPTGDIEPTIRETPKTGTLFMQGQVLLRADYPALWQWANDQGLLQVGLFGPGNGTTTFGLPNFAGRYIVGGGTFESEVYDVGRLLGDSSPVITLGQMPSHDHGSGGSHTGHFPAQSDDFITTMGPDYGLAAWNDPGTTKGSHTHSTEGSDDPFDNRPASITVNWMIWT